MNYSEHQKQVWDSLAIRYGSASPLRAVISKGDGWRGDLTNYYFDKTTRRLLGSTVDFAEKDTVLDVGCGIGRLSLWLSRRVKSVMGVDISLEMIKVAKQRATSRRFDNLEFSVNDGHTLSFPPEQFSVIICCGILKCIIDDAHLSSLINDMSTVLKPGGHIVIIDQVDPGGPIILGAMDEIGERAVLRKPGHYIGEVTSRGVNLVSQYSLYNQRLVNKYAVVVSSLGGLRYGRTAMIGAKMAALVDVELDNLLKRRVKDRRGFRLFHFRKPV